MIKNSIGKRAGTTRTRNEKHQRQSWTPTSTSSGTTPTRRRSGRHPFTRWRRKYSSLYSPTASVASGDSLSQEQEVTNEQPNSTTDSLKDSKEKEDADSNLPSSSNTSTSDCTIDLEDTIELVGTIELEENEYETEDEEEEEEEKERVSNKQEEQGEVRTPTVTVEPQIVTEDKEEEKDCAFANKEENNSRSALVVVTSEKEEVQEKNSEVVVQVANQSLVHDTKKPSSNLENHNNKKTEDLVEGVRVVEKTPTTASTTKPIVPTQTKDSETKQQQQQIGNTQETQVASLLEKKKANLEKAEVSQDLTAPTASEDKQQQPVGSSQLVTKPCISVVEIEQQQKVSSESKQKSKVSAASKDSTNDTDCVTNKEQEDNKKKKSILLKSSAPPHQQEKKKEEEVTFISRNTRSRSKMGNRSVKKKEASSLENSATSPKRTTRRSSVSSSTIQDSKTNTPVQGNRRRSRGRSLSTAKLPSQLIPNFSGGDTTEGGKAISTPHKATPSPKRGGGDKQQRRQDGAPTTDKRKRKEQDIVPLDEDPVFEMKVSATVERHFYDGVVVQSQPKFYDAEDFGDTAQPRWKVHVGDLIAVGVKPSNPPLKKPFPRKSIWYPFTCDWSPGQVVAIWQDRTSKKGNKNAQFGHFQMQIRWFYRLQDLEADGADDVVEELSKTKDLHPQKTIYETLVHQEVPVSTALGKLVVTSWDVHRMIGKYTDPESGIPQTHYVCNQRLDEDDKLIETMDWKDYDEAKIGTLPSPLIRGFECPNTEAHKNKKLKQAYVKCITKRWKERLLQEADDRDEMLSGGDYVASSTPKKVTNKKNRKSVEPSNSRKSLTSATIDKKSPSKEKKDKKVSKSKQKKVDLQDLTIEADDKVKPSASTLQEKEKRNKTVVQAESREKSQANDRKVVLSSERTKTKTVSVPVVAVVTNEKEDKGPETATTPATNVREITRKQLPSVDKSNDDDEKKESKKTPVTKVISKKHGKVSKAAETAVTPAPDARKVTQKQPLFVEKADDDKKENKKTPVTKVISKKRGRVSKAAETSITPATDVQEVTQKQQPSVDKADDNDDKKESKKIPVPNEASKKHGRASKAAETAVTPATDVQEVTQTQLPSVDKASGDDEKKESKKTPAPKEASKKHGKASKAAETAVTPDTDVQGVTQKQPPSIDKASGDDDKKENKKNPLPKVASKKDSKASKAAETAVTPATDVQEVTQKQPPAADKASGDDDKKENKKNPLPKVAREKRGRASKAAEEETKSHLITKTKENSKVESEVVDTEDNAEPARKKRNTQPETEDEIVHPAAPRSKVSKVPSPAQDKMDVDSTAALEQKVSAKKRTRSPDNANGSIAMKEATSHDSKKSRNEDPKKAASEESKMTKELAKLASDSQDMITKKSESDKLIPSSLRQDGEGSTDTPGKAGEKKKATAKRNRRKWSGQEIAPPVEAVLYSSNSDKTKRRDFLKQANIQIMPNTCAPRVIAPKDHGKFWQLHVGDIVCMENPDAGDQAMHILKQHTHRGPGSRLWYPFVKPWSICQVLSIYHDVIKNGSHETIGETYLEVRWFPRESELSRVGQKMIHFELDTTMEEVFEGDNVETRLAASKVLGLVEIVGYMSEIINVGEISSHYLTTSAPTIQCRCNYFVYQPESAARFQPLFCSGSVPEMWFHRMIQRGLSISLLMKKDKKLKNASSELRKNTFDLFSDLQEEDDLDMSAETPYRSISLGGTNKQRKYFSSIEINPPWDSFHLSSLIWPVSDRVNRKKDLRWTVSVGDVVAVETDEESASIPTFASKEARWYPFSAPWSPCQILAIYRDISGKDSGNNSIYDIFMEVRWFYREADIEEGMNSLVKFNHHKNEPQMEILFETDDVETQPTPLSAVLGPVALVPSSDGGHYTKDDITQQVPPFMPLALHTYGGRYNVSSSKMKPKASKQKAFDFEQKDLVKRGLELSTHYNTRKEKRQMIGLLYGNDESDDECSDNEDDRNSISAIESATDLAAKNKHQERVQQSRASSEQASKRSSVCGPSQQDKSTDANADNAVQCQQAVNDFINDGGDADLSELKPRAKQNQATMEKPPVTLGTKNGEDLEEHRVLIPDSLQPYHQDLSSLKSYYTEIDIIPPYGNYEKGKFIKSQDKAKPKIWRVKLGDVVALHWEDGTGTSSSSGTFSHSKYSPYTVPWGLGEVVTIWQTHPSKEDMETKGESTSKLAKKRDIMVEFRWVYRKDELPGSLQLKSSSDNDNEYEEVIETDHLEDCNATSLLAPVILHSTQVKSQQSESPLGIPVLDFHCRRFWSIHRKALVPCGDLSSMGARGRMHSRYLGKDQVLKAALKKTLSITDENDLDQTATSSSQPAKVSVSDAFREVIKKLSLTDASEETNVLGLTLTGREKEQERITQFLRSAIIGEASSKGDQDGKNAREQASVKSSIFIAGPPGTGKTACVRSVIEQLRREQSVGSIPPFEFISLNGMEMRHPFEAYVKFWEALSGSRKDKRAPDVAASLLERHFSQSSTDRYEWLPTPPVTVLLLDEIDYLVTKKQTVLYNFFDWPLRTSQNLAGNRLVVVGISNTLNLPERLKPSVQSRLGGERCDFQSYPVDAMVKILNMKIAQDSTTAPAVFDKDAILFAARKTAAVSGDVRKALQICKSAAEAVLMELESEGGSSGGRPKIVRISDVQKVTRDSFSSVVSKAVSNSTPFEALLLVTLASLSRTSGRGAGGFDMKEVMTKMESIASGSGDLQYTPAPTLSETIDILHRLGEARIVSLHTPKSSTTTFRAAQGGSGGAWPLISLPMEDSNVLSALRDSPHGALAEKYLGRAGLW